MLAYLIDENNIYIASQVIDPVGKLPRCVFVEPPALSGTEVAQFQGGQWVVLPEYPVPTLPVQSPTERWTAIKTIRDHKTQNGGYKVGANWFHSDTFSRTQQMGLVMLGAAMPPGLQWKTLSGAFVPMTPTLAQQVFAAAAAQDAALFAHAEHLRATPGADINAGWPETFSPPQQP